jgi:predicted short-subunit dehydrogenase-like oxidoreductase (DUF2520 family)
MTDAQSNTPTIGIIGAGRVGTALAVSLANIGYSIVAVYSRTADHAAALAERLGSTTAATPEAVIEAADLTLLTVSDDEIEPVANAAADKLTAMQSSPKAVVHTSGIHSREALAALSAHGLMTGSLHPALPVAASLADGQFEGAAFALEADQPLLFDWLEQIVNTLQAHSFRLGQDQKALYHTALVMASNYTVSLYAFAENLLTTVGLSKEDADGILGALLQATVDNLQQQGVPDALTGPLVRGDTGTLRRHLQTLQQAAPEGVKAYRTLARLTYPLLSARGVALDPIERLFQEDESSWPE